MKPLNFRAFSLYPLHTKNRDLTHYTRHNSWAFLILIFCSRFRFYSLIFNNLNYVLR